MRGVWTTDAPAYAGRALKLTHSVVVFDAGPLGYDVHSVLEVESHDVGGGATAYTVYYRASEGFKDKFVFTYRPEPHPMLRLSHRDEIWTRSNASIGS